MTDSKHVVLDFHGGWDESNVKQYITSEIKRL